MDTSSAAGFRRLTAIVLNYRTPQLTRCAVESLLSSTRRPNDVLLVDNGASEGDAQRLIPLGSPVRYVATPCNLGFSGGMNVGIKTALAEGADAVLLMNSDATVSAATLEMLEACLMGLPAAGLAGPVLLAPSTPDLVISRGLSYDRRSGRMRDRVLNPRAIHDTAHQEVDALSGCVLLIRRTVFETIGLLDEAYFYSFEDLDFCLRARQSGFASVLVDRATAWHEGSRSIGADSPRRLYFAARNHLRLAARVAPADGRVASAARTLSIVGLNVAHAVRSRGGSVVERLRAVVDGTRDHLAGRYGEG